MTVPTPPVVVILVCAWCTPRIELEHLARTQPALSHGICLACIRKLEAA